MLQPESCEVAAGNCPPVGGEPAATRAKDLREVDSVLVWEPEVSSWEGIFFGSVSDFNQLGGIYRQRWMDRHLDRDACIAQITCQENEHLGKKYVELERTN